MKITIISSEFCTNCGYVKELLDTKGIEYKTADINDSDTLSDILLASYTGTSLPIFKINGLFYDEKAGLKTVLNGS